MNGQSKVELILQLKNRMKTGLSRAKMSVNKSVSSMKGRFKSLKLSAIRNIRSISSEIPMIGRAFQLIRNPIIMATAAIIGVGAIISSTSKKAKEFEHAFLPIKQLNLNKSSEQMQNYQNKIKKAAFDVGTNLKDSTKAMYDLQSATGLYGNKAIDVFKKVGNYSIATGANIGDAMNSTTKAMKAFGLGVADIDKLLESNAKTVQVGITTFDELAKVQTEYAGAAATAGQGVNEANKVFAMFTSVAKNSDIGANMTKTFFQGLTQQAGKIKKKLGVKIFDKGEMRKADDILKDIANKFKTMNKNEISETINAIGGPDGLRAALGKVSTGAEDMIQTFESFDNSKFSLGEALKNAKKDATVLSQIANNRKEIVMVEMGQKFLPIWVTVLERVNELLSFVWDNFDTIWAVVKNVAIGLAALKLGMIAFNIVTWANPIGAIVGLVAALIIGITILVKKTEGWGKSWMAIKAMIKLSFQQFKIDLKFIGSSIAYGFKLSMLKFKSLGQYLKELFSNIGKGIKLAFSGDFKGAKAAFKSNITTAASAEIEALREQREKAKKEYVKTTYGNVKKFLELKQQIGIKWKKEEEPETDEQTDEQTNNNLNNNNNNLRNTPQGELANNSINNITGSAKQIKTINVSIGNLFKGNINTADTDMEQMNSNQLEEFFSNMLLRAIRNLEVSH